MSIPSKYATFDIEFGEGKKHLYCLDTASLELHETDVDARAYAEEQIKSGAKMVAVCKIESVLVARPAEFDELRSE